LLNILRWLVQLVTLAHRHLMVGENPGILTCRARIATTSKKVRAFGRFESKDPRIPNVYRSATNRQHSATKVHNTPTASIRSLPLTGARI
jgi:hypothetical protein